MLKKQALRGFEPRTFCLTVLVKNHCANCQTYTQESKHKVSLAFRTLIVNTIVSITGHEKTKVKLQILCPSKSYHAAICVHS